MSDTIYQYEAMFLLPAGAAAELQNALDLVKGIIERHAGQILVLKKWDERKLTYEIAGNKRGLYVIAYFKAPGKAITQIERDVNLSEQVLRVLVTRADHLNQEEMAAVEPQPIQPREERPAFIPGMESFDRGPRRDDRGPRGPRRDESEEAAGAAKE